MIALTTRDGGNDAKLQCDAAPSGDRDEPTPVRVNWPTIIRGTAHSHTT